MVMGPCTFVSRFPDMCVCTPRIQRQIERLQLALDQQAASAALHLGARANDT